MKSRTYEWLREKCMLEHGKRFRTLVSLIIRGKTKQAKAYARKHGIVYSLAEKFAAGK